MHTMVRNELRNVQVFDEKVELFDVYLNDPVHSQSLYVLRSWCPLPTLRSIDFGGKRRKSIGLQTRIASALMLERSIDLVCYIRI